VKHSSFALFFLGASLAPHGLPAPASAYATGKRVEIVAGGLQRGPDKLETSYNLAHVPNGDLLANTRRLVGRQNQTLAALLAHLAALLAHLAALLAHLAEVETYA